jgi:hypothetical protein
LDDGRACSRPRQWKHGHERARLIVNTAARSQRLQKIRKIFSVSEARRRDATTRQEKDTATNHLSFPASPRRRVAVSLSVPRALRHNLAQRS